MSRPLPAVLGLVLAALPARAQDNILLIIADDLGVDRVAVYGEHPSPGHTPNIDMLAGEGILFRNAWSNPVCSPTRAAMLTGRYAFRTGIGTIIRENSFTDPGLGLEELTLPEILAPTYATVALGKWHLANDFTQGPTHPLDSGFDAHSGSLTNLRPGLPNTQGADDLYFDWEKVVNGTRVRETTYATTDTVDDALRALQSLPEPWFIWLAFNAPHKPFHAPPPHLHTFQLSGHPDLSPVPHMMAMTEAMDTELGRLLASVDRSDTTILFLGDNGTTGEATSAPNDPERAKTTVYQGGLHVPLIVAGAGVKHMGSECAALVSAVDVFATVRELAGYGTQARDGVSMLPYFSDPSLPSLRDHVYAEVFGPNGPYPYNRIERAIRGERYKLIDRRLLHEREFYDLLQDPYELDNLLLGTLTPEQAQALDGLDTALARLWNTR